MWFLLDGFYTFCAKHKFYDTPPEANEKLQKNIVLCSSDYLSVDSTDFITSCIECVASKTKSFN